MSSNLVLILAVSICLISSTQNMTLTTYPFPPYISPSRNKRLTWWSYGAFEDTLTLQVGLKPTVMSRVALRYENLYSTAAPWWHGSSLTSLTQSLAPITRNLRLPHHLCLLNNIYLAFTKELLLSISKYLNIYIPVATDDIS